MLALCGGAAGFLLARKTEYEKWSRQARTESFVSFMRALNEAEDSIYDEISSPKFLAYNDDQRHMWVTLKMVPLYNEARVTRLFLSERDREALQQAINKLETWHLGANRQLADSRQQAITAIEELLYRNLTTASLLR